MTPLVLAKNNVTFNALCMQFTLDKIPSKIILFTTPYFSLLFHVEKLQI